MLNNPLQMHLKLLKKRVIRKTAKATGDLTGKRIAETFKNCAPFSDCMSGSTEVYHAIDLDKVMQIII